MPEIPDFSRDVPPSSYRDVLGELGQSEQLELRRGMRYPARQFERMYGVQGIAANWRMLDGINEEGIQQQMDTRLVTLLRDNLTQKILAGESRAPVSSGAKSAGYYVDVMREIGFQYETPFYQSVWDNLASLNPQLQHVNVNREDGERLHHAISGVISQLNVNDINFFLHRQVPDPQAYEAGRVELERILGQREWLPSPQTQEAILTQLHERQISDGYKGRARAAANGIRHCFIAIPTKHKGMEACFIYSREEMPNQAVKKVGKIDRI